MEGVGRKKHLTALFSIFEPYATCWEDFGGFLKVLFGETTPPSLAPSGRGEPAVRVEPLETRQCLCRHNEGGQHHSYLYTDERAEARGGELDIAVFNHTRYSRPCITTGAQEEKKNPGIVVADLCTKARNYLLLTGRQIEGHGVSCANSMSTDLQTTPRLSTKMRVATLAYLLNFADAPEQLAEQFRRLHDDRELFILHLCGCGLSSRNKQRHNIWHGGCCEKTHLQLGYHEENHAHRCYHYTITTVKPEDYTVVCESIRKTTYGKNLF